MRISLFIKDISYSDRNNGVLGGLGGRDVDVDGGAILGEEGGELPFMHINFERHNILWKFFPFLKKTS